MNFSGKMMTLGGLLALAGIFLLAPAVSAKHGNPVKVDQGYGPGYQADQKPPCPECDKQRKMHPERYPSASEYHKTGQPRNAHGKKYYKPKYPPKTVKYGPPPWAPAHGHRARHMYRYYPRSRVYYDRGRSLWFWMAGTRWRSGPALPPSIRLDVSGMVRLGMDVDRPYSWHDQVRRYFPPPR